MPPAAVRLEVSVTSRETSDIADIREFGLEFRRRFEKRCRQIKPAQFDWYPYDTFGNLSHLDRMLTGERRRLLALARGYPVIDIGCADGALAFFLESMGMRVHALDHPSSNFNRMMGVRALKEALGSQVEIIVADLEREINLPARLYGMAFFLGTLYHVKNPFHVLESLASRARYLVLSTRIARFTPGRRTDLTGEPVAYLLDEGEANSDWTNFWIFSHPGLLRLLHRAGWQVLDHLVVGAGDTAEPASNDLDARAFCLAASRLVDLENAVRLEDGWHDLEFNSWRWTARKFSVRLEAPAGARTLKFHFVIPNAIFERLGTLSLSVKVGETALPSQRFASAGSHCYIASLPDGVSGDLHVDFTLDKALYDPAMDSRELGLMVCFSMATVGDGRTSDAPITLY